VTKQGHRIALGGRQPDREFLNQGGSRAWTATVGFNFPKALTPDEVGHLIVTCRGVTGCVPILPRED
jgi:hypothetical protein